MSDPTAHPARTGSRPTRPRRAGRAALSRGRLAVTVEGLADEEEAVDAATGALGRLAKRRGVEPARVIDRTPRRLLDALRVP